MPVRAILQAFGDLVAVEVFLRLFQDREQDQADQPGIELALEFLRKPLLVVGTAFGVRHGSNWLHKCLPD
jgi:hypothetical protein